MLDEKRNMVERFGLKNVPMVYGSIDPFNLTVWPAGPLGQRLGLRPRGPFDTTNQYVEPIVDDQEEMIEITETDEDGIGMQDISIINYAMLQKFRYHFKVLCNRFYVLKLITCLVDIREKSM